MDVRLRVRHRSKTVRAETSHVTNPGLINDCREAALDFGRVKALSCRRLPRPQLSWKLFLINRNRLDGWDCCVYLVVCDIWRMVSVELEGLLWMKTEEGVEGNMTTCR